MQISQPLIKSAFTITLVLATLSGNSASGEAQPSRQIISERPKPPKTGTPSGDPTPGGTRPEATCKQANKPLTALFANKGSDFTVSEYPTFWFYIPYAPEDISYIEFLLLDETEGNTIYKASVKLTEKSGIIKITIPSAPKYALTANEDYHWYFKLDCKPDTTDEPDLVLNGWIRRISITSQMENQIEAIKPRKYIVYKENGIWYDAITNLAELHFANPQNHELDEAWANLLESIGYAKMIQEPFVASELLPLEN